MPTEPRLYHAHARNEYIVSAPPFWLPPRPDEILGSWIARIRLHNGDGWWHAALHEAGFGLRSDAYVFDIPTYSIPMEAFLQSIGMESYERVLLDLTTLPYWLAFDAGAPDSGTLLGTSLLPVLGTRKGIIKRVSAMARRYRAWAGIRFCPRCLDEDILTVGEPYWHRAHQLPNVTCCPDHHVLLRTCCARCGRAYIPDHTGRIPLPLTKCECGCELNKSAVPVDKTSSWMKLAIISRDALIARQPACSRTEIRAFLRSRVRSRELRPIIDEAYRDRFLTATLPPALPDRDDWLWLSTSGHFSQLRANDCCALLAAMNIDFRSAQRDAVATRNRQDARVDCGRPRNAPSIEAARKVMLQRARTAPSESASRDGLNYWVLRLLDSEWLRQNFPQSHFTEVPSMQKDRELIRWSANRSIPDGSTRTYHWRLIAQTVAGRRAAIRDTTWFEKQRRRYFDFRVGPVVQPRLQTTVPPVAGLAVVSRMVSVLRNALTAVSGDAPPSKPHHNPDTCDQGRNDRINDKENVETGQRPCPRRSACERGTPSTSY